MVSQHTMMNEMPINGGWWQQHDVYLGSSPALPGADTVLRGIRVNLRIVLMGGGERRVIHAATHQGASTTPQGTFIYMTKNVLGVKVLCRFAARTLIVTWI